MRVVKHIQISSDNKNTISFVTTEVICKSHSESSSGTDTKSSTELQHNDYHFTEELSSSPVIPSPARDNAVETARIVEYLGQTDRTGTDEGKIHQREKRNGRRKMKKSKDEDQITSVDRNMRYDSKEVKLCLKPKGIGKQCDPDHVAKELARCLSEVSFSLSVCCPSLWLVLKCINILVEYMASLNIK